MKGLLRVKIFVFAVFLLITATWVCFVSLGNFSSETTTYSLPKAEKLPCPSCGEQTDFPDIGNFENQFDPGHFPVRLFPAVYSDDRDLMREYSAPGSIPRILHIMWKTDRLPAASVYNLRRWRRLHPDWLFLFWTDNDLDKWMGRFLSIQGGLLDTYREFPLHMMRVDFARYVILYVIGGVYADIDAVPIRSLEPMLRHHSAIVAREQEANAVSTSSMSTILASNFLMASRPGHPFWPRLMRFIQGRSSERIILRRTGPMALNDALRLYKEESGLVHFDASVFLAPSLYFNPPVVPTGDALHIRILQKYACPKLFFRWEVTAYQKHICKTLKEKGIIDYSASFRYPRFFKDSFVKHLMYDSYGKRFAERMGENINVRNSSLGLISFGDLNFNFHVKDAYTIEEKMMKSTFEV